MRTASWNITCLFYMQFFLTAPVFGTIFLVYHLGIKLDEICEISDVSQIERL